MKPIPIKATSKVFGVGKKKDMNQHLNTLALMKYYHEHVPEFKKMWKEQKKEYWIQFMISLIHSFKAKDLESSKDPEVKLFIEKKTAYALQNITDNLVGHSFPAVNKMMEVIFKMYKDFYKIMLPSISTVQMPKEDQSLYDIFDYLFGPECEFPSVCAFIELCTLYTFAAESLTRICKEFESDKYPTVESPNQKDYWEIPMKWHRSNYKPTYSEIKLVASYETLIKKFIKIEGKDVKWISDNLEEIKNSCKQNEELSILPKEVDISKDGLKDLYLWFFFNSPVMLPELTDDYSDVNCEMLVHPFNQFYLTYYHSIFNARFLAVATDEFKAMYGILGNKKVDLDDEALGDRMLELCKLTAFVEKISEFTFDQLTNEDFHFYFDRGMEITANNKEENKEETGSDISCSSLLEVKSSNAWKSWDPKDNASLDTHQATLDRMPWDIPFLMSWQENMFSALLKMDIAAVPLRIYPVAETYKQTIINFNRLLKESIFLMHSSMIIADHVYYMEGEKDYNWTDSVDYRKTLHEIGYRFRSVMDFICMPGQNSVTTLAKKAWAVDKSAHRPKWDPGFWENVMDLEKFFIHSRRHFLHWDWAPKPYETKRLELFKEAYQKITSVKFNKKNCETNCYYEVNKNFNRFDLDDTEKALAKNFRQNLKLDTSQVCEVFSKAHYITKQEASRFQRKLTSGKVPQEAVTFITYQGFIFKKCEILRNKMDDLAGDLDLNRPKFIELMLEHRQFISGFKVNYLMQQLINDDAKFCPKPTSASIDKALVYAEEKAFNGLKQEDVEIIVEKNRKRIWADNPIPIIPKNSIPELKKEHSFKTNYWKTQSVYHNYSLMEKHRTELLRIVIDKYFSIPPGTTGVSLFPYWKTLICFIPAELFVTVRLYEAEWDTKDCISKIFQISNYRLIWLREKVMEWCKNPEVSPKKIKKIKNSEIGYNFGELYVRMRLAGNTLRDLYMSRFTVNEEFQPITKRILDFNVIIEVLLNKVFDIHSKLSDIGLTTIKNCFLVNAEESVEYMETLLEHACLCWNYKPLELHEDFRPASFENCETIIYIAKKLLYLCLTIIANKEDLDGEIEFCLLKAHSMESEIIDQKAVRGISSPEHDDIGLYMACMDTWRGFTNMYEKAVKKDVPIPEVFTKGSNTWKKILKNFKEDKLINVTKFLKIDQVMKNSGLNNFSNFPSFSECEEDLIYELKNLGLLNKLKQCEKKNETKASEDKKSEDKKNEDQKTSDKPTSGKRSNINKKPEQSEEIQPEDKLIVKALLETANDFDAFKLAGKSSTKVEVEGKQMYVSRLKIDRSSLKLDEFNLEKSMKTFDKLVVNNVNKKKKEEEEKLKKEEMKRKEEELEKKKKEAEEKKNRESCGVNIAAEGFKKMFGTLAKPKNNETEKSKMNEKGQTENANGIVDKSDQSKEKNKICAACKKKAGEGVKLKKCSKCKEDNIPNPKFYCGRECQLKDWVDIHRQEHTVLAQGKQ